ncbi:MAG: group II intron reverse transcriptase/maturase [Bacteroidota bacterium]
MSNVVLHELDRFVEDIIIPQYTKGKVRKANPAYDKLTRLKQKAKQAKDVEGYRKLVRLQRTVSSKLPNDPNYRRLRYVRYADDFILGFNGPKTEAVAIKEQIGKFLQQIKLQMSKEKTFITHALTQKARFLGYDITTRNANTKITRRSNGIKARSINGSIELKVPPDVRSKWINRYTKAGKTHQIGAYVNLSDFEIVSTYGTQLRGVINYYAMADDIGISLSYVRWACMESARKTLAAKHQIKNPRKTHTKYRHKGGKSDKGRLEWQHLRVTIERENKKPLIAKFGESPLRTRKTVYTTDKLPPAFIMGHRSELTTRLVKGECELCGAKSPLEAHHVNKLDNLKKRWKGRAVKPRWVQWMIARRRKVIVVCRPCHKDITHGRYDGRKVES